MATEGGARFGSRIKISGHLIGQNDKNFEIYPFDWSQVASWGLAAEGEALTIIENSARDQWKIVEIHGRNGYDFLCFL